jgi:hypothetical protein
MCRAAATVGYRGIGRCPALAGSREHADQKSLLQLDDRELANEHEAGLERRIA